MHIPDGFLNDRIAGAFGAAAVAVLSAAWHNVHELLTEPALQKAYAVVGNKIRATSDRAGKKMRAVADAYVARMGLLASLIFSLQMFNFPIGSGTSGHFLGGVLAAVFLGPWGGLLVIAAILGVQALFYADGGLAAIGANIINMGVFGCLFGYYVLIALRNIVKLPERLSLMIAAWASVVLASVGCSFELALSGTYGLPQILAAMVPTHMLIGLGEGLVTILCVHMLIKVMGWQEFSHEEK